MGQATGTFAWSSSQIATAHQTPARRARGKHKQTQGTLCASSGPAGALVCEGESAVRGARATRCLTLCLVAERPILAQEFLRQDRHWAVALFPPHFNRRQHVWRDRPRCSYCSRDRQCSRCVSPCVPLVCVCVAIMSKHQVCLRTPPLIERSRGSHAQGFCSQRGRCCNRVALIHSAPSSSRSPFPLVARRALVAVMLACRALWLHRVAEVLK